MPPRFSQKSPNNNSERHDATADTNDDANSKIMTMPEPPPTSSSHSLYHLILQNRIANERKQTTTKTAIPLAGIHDALSAKIFAQHGAPALFLSGFGVSASLLGVPDAGTTNLVEMEMITRRACEAVRRAGAGTAGSGIRTGSSSGRHHRPTPPIIADGDTGYGGSANVLRTVSALGNAGAAAITIEDQKFPKKCTVAAGSEVRIASREEAAARVKCALGARDSLYGDGRNRGGAGYPWIAGRTDCRMACGFDEAVERCLRFEEAGAEIVYAENLQSRDEYERLRRALDSRTVTMIAQVQETTNTKTTTKTTNAGSGSTEDLGGGSKPLLTVQEIGEMGYDLALFGVTPLQCVVGALESTARDFLRRDERGEALVGSGIIGGDGEEFGSSSSSSSIAMADFATLKRVVGFDELADFETNFPCT